MKSRSVIRAIHFLAIAAFMLVIGSLTCQSQTLSVSIPVLHLAGKERITGFEIHIRSGMIARLPKVPYGWSISIDNDPSWNTTIRGAIAVGAAAVDPDFFRNFLVVEVDKDFLDEKPFELQGLIFVTGDYVAERRIDLVNKDFTAKVLVDKKIPVQEKR
jgi:hypothetical protein